MRLKKILIPVLFVSFLAAALSDTPKLAEPVSSRSANAILFWNEIAYDAFGGPKYQHSLMASRINAMVHLAIHDALNGIEEKYSRFAFNGNDKGADPIAAASAAAHVVLMHEIPQRKTFIDSALSKMLKNVKGGAAKSKGLALGKAAAKAVILKRASDGANGNVVGAIAASKVPGVYQPVPPFDFAFAPHWKDMPTFALRNSAQFRITSHPSISSEEYAKNFNEVKQFGQKNSAVRSADQTAYAKFWYEFSEAGWNRVARKVTVSENLNMLEAARLFALVNMALADAYIAGWDSKFHYNFWRPYTAIRNAGGDGNTATTADPTWESSEPTPPVHDYPSTHSALGAAAATVLAMILGDNTAFTMSSPTAAPLGSTRSFKRFSDAAKENANSRVMAGIHFRFSCEAGLNLGDKIGKWTAENSLMPLK
jgi:hypothetical protein